MGQPLDFDAMIREGADFWRGYNKHLDAMEKLLEEHPDLAREMAKTLWFFTRDQARLLRRYHRARFGIKIIGSYPRYGLRIVDRERARFDTLLEVAYRRDLMHRFLTFDAALWSMTNAISEADRQGSGAVLAALSAFFYVMRNAPGAYAPLAAGNKGGPPGEQRLQEAAAGALSAWVRSKIRMYGSLREALAGRASSKEGADRRETPDEVLMRELPGTLLDELGALEAAALKPGEHAAHLNALAERGVFKTLVNRVSGTLRTPGRSGRIKADSDGASDLELAGFLHREETLRRGREAGLPPREYELLELLVASGWKLSHAEAARHMGVALSTAKTFRRRIRKTFGAA